MDVLTHSQFVVKAIVLSLLLLTPSGFGIDSGDFKARIVWFPSSARAAAPAAPEKGKALLDGLIQKAQQEGEVVATIQSS